MAVGYNGNDVRTRMSIVAFDRAVKVMQPDASTLLPALVDLVEFVTVDAREFGTCHRCTTHSWDSRRARAPRADKLLDAPKHQMKKVYRKCRAVDHKRFQAMAAVFHCCLTEVCSGNEKSTFCSSIIVLHLRLYARPHSLK
jgi:hypothetical protein